MSKKPFNHVDIAVTLDHDTNYRVTRMPKKDMSVQELHKILRDTTEMIEKAYPDLVTPRA